MRAQITIAGDVYGGGKEGAVGTGNTVGVVTATDVAVDPTKTVTPAEEVKLTGDNPTDVTSVTINSGLVRTVFGGGQNGRTFGNTSVTVRGNDTQIGLEALKNSVHGGLFGAGDGALAYVFGNSTVTIEGGQIIQKVFGGGNQADLMGHTKVHLLGGNIRARGVFGGARMANIYGHSYVLVDGANLKRDLLINNVYGGNDVAGSIMSSETWAWTKQTSDNMATPFSPKTAGVDRSWNAFVHITNPDKKTTDATTGEVTNTGKKIYIGQLFGGGDGDYTYTANATDNTKYDVQIALKEWDDEANEGAGGYVDKTPVTYTVNGAPELGKTYLEIDGGSIVYAYGGGNAATVTDRVVICVDNPSDVVNSITDASAITSDNPTGELLTNDRFKEMGINLGFSYPSSGAFQIGSFFGGNNKAPMAIRPTWNLLSGKIRNLYSGGNAGAMTSPDGLLLVIPQNSTIKVDNVYGGCRMADVNPDDRPMPAFEGTIAAGANSTSYKFPATFAARMVIAGGDINNVYGGNDISGKVFGGNAVGIRTSIRGDVYGGGNGSYPYTDNPLMEGDETYGDLFYKISDVPGATTSVEALNAIRPNAEQVSIRLVGTEDKPTIIHGGVFCGGNSATIMTDKKDPIVELKIGSYVIADSVFLGNNGANMVKYNEKDETNMIGEGVLRTMRNTLSNGIRHNTMDLTDEATFAAYMGGATMALMPSVVFDSKAYGDALDYKDYTSYIGSLFCGGNVGSMKIDGKKTTLNFNKEIIVYNRVVGGCNNANVEQSDFNAAYYGGLLGAADESGNKLEMNFNGLKIQPMRWKLQQNDAGQYVKDAEDNYVRYVNPTTNQEELEWNTIDGAGNPTPPVITAKAFDAETDISRRLLGGNIYGGCYNSGHVEGNVIININKTIVERDKLFDVTNDEDDILYENTERGTYDIKTRNTGVILSEQGMDVLGSALNVFGGGFGKGSEIWGSTTVNLNKGYVFQIFGGGEAGAIGHEKDADGNYIANENYSTYVNLNGATALPGVARGATGDSPDMAECEFIYGGAFEGLIAGSTHVRLGNGRIFNSFAGSCNADILGHSETYVGQWTEGNATKTGFPWIRDHIYGGNDLGGNILGHADFSGRIRDEVKSMVDGSYGVASYMEYTQGRVRNILGGCFGDYDYTDETYSNRITNKPYLHNAFVNIRPNDKASNAIKKVFGAGEGYTGDRDGDKLQDHSYVLIDIPDGVKNFADMEVFGAGAYNGLGMRYTAEETFEADFDINEATAVIDLLRGRIGAAYGGSLDEGVTRRTMVNVPDKSTIIVNNIFGGAFGNHILPPCDVYESNVNYRSSKAYVNGAIYGGNNNVRRTVYAHVNVSAPARKENGYSVTVYGAGKGMETWAEYTEVNLEEGANVWEVYGGGEMGNVLNAESVQRYMQTYADRPADKLLTEDTDVEDDKNWNNADRWVDGVAGGTLTDVWKDEWKKVWKTAWTIGDYYNPIGENKRYVSNNYTNLYNKLARPAEMDDRTDRPEKTYRYNTNVIIHKGATVGNYAYGGGYGNTSQPMSGSVYGTTYIALLGGTVNKDMYAAGTAGSVNDLFACGAYSDDNPTGFTASANAYVEGGTVRNVYGGGWRGGVGFHAGLVSDVANNESDLDGETHVIIGKLDGTSFTNGIPAINRNVYGGGEGGAIYGTAYVKVYNGRIGYRYENNTYVEQLDDAKAGDNLLDRSGNVFGGGYVANSYVDVSDLKMYGGIVRGGLYGGGEIGPIGRGTVNVNAPAPEGTFRNGVAKIYKGGATHVTLYSGHVLRDVFGGGRGFDNWDGEGYMTDDEKKTMDLSSKGYVFGSTEVRILGGEVGTADGVAKNFGNVFGGGNVGYVYSAEGTKTEKAVPGTDDKTYYYYDSNGSLTEDCSVIITPWCLAKEDVSIPNGGGSYAAGDYVPADDLDRLQNKSSAHSSIWEKLDLSGITIHNAVFAGGNVTVGGDAVYANAKTVLGNVSANVVDVYNRDLITVGTEHVGGLYGDGNLTLVDGYRELNISNYGTDYYGMSDNISLEEYYKLTDRERAYFALEYRCVNPYTATTTTGSKTYSAGDRITEEIYNGLAEADKANWELWGFCSIYAGRLMNTIQRADFCGIFGSRLVLQGAKDRVPSVADKTDYTVNRVGEVSLNQVNTIAGETDADAKTHGNYFGIYSIVNCMGALTSDVDFYNTTRATDNANYAVDGKTFYEWKEAFPKERKRNNGKVANHVALASGVYLELTTEKSTPDVKDWGYITGVAQLELINVKAGLGGGYVYAKNVHGVRSASGNDQTILSAYNKATDSHPKAVTNKVFVYSSGDLKEVQTSGNFVHNVKQIIDDCYPTSNAYSGENAAPAHYWFIRGTSYVYDQYITAYTGVSNAYSKAQKIPLNINAASYGKMRLEDVKVNLYAYYYSTEPNESERTPLQNTDKDADTYSVLVNNDVTYHLNDSISYWDWLQLSEVEQRHFVADTYVTIAECKIGNTTYPEGSVLLPATYQRLKDANPTVYHVAREEDVDFDFVFRRSNNLTHDLGYVVTYAVDNPSAWAATDPYGTYSPATSGVYGQRFYEEGEIIGKTVRDEYEAMGTHKPADTDDKKQAKMAEAYVVKEDIRFTDGDETYNFIAGTPLCKEDYSASAWATISSKVEEARICTGTMEFEGAYASKSMLFGEVVTSARYNELVDIYKDVYNVSEAVAKTEVDKSLSKAYMCYEEGYYGGGYFEAGQKYTALKGWAALSTEDREKFSFNYDALNLLIDPLYSGDMKLYDNNQSPFTYSTVKPIDYEAVYSDSETLSYIDNNGVAQTVAPGATISRVQYEAIPNEQYHYSPIKVDYTTVYVVRSAFIRGDTPYTVGQTITSETYSYLTDDQKEHVTALSFREADVNSTYYYCREDYRISSDVNGHAVTDTRTGRTLGKGSDVTPGVLISQDDYLQLSNLQKNFSIQGSAPEELTTLYVASESDIYDLQKDRIITVIFSYDYTESDESGTHIEPISERHIINIHIHFESGVPEIGTLHSPTTVLPGEYVGLFQPTVKPGAYEIMGGGWEIFENEEDAERHRNGQDFTNKTPVYWYQDGQYLVYYAKTYLGKTYSNYVPFSVANYHDMRAIMADTEHHLYVDHPDVKRDSKVYLNDYSGDDKSGIDLLRDFFDLSVSGLSGHAPLNDRVKAGNHLDFFLHANQTPTAYADWTPIGDENNCFAGTLHGEGYYVSGLNKSLFGNLCGHVYNLGASGSFTSAGIADTGDGYVENSWVKTTGTPDGSVYAVFGNPSDAVSTTTQMENCYYGVAGGDYKTAGSTHGLARKMTDRQFYNGEVAYNLNGYYLKERYNRQATEADKVKTYEYVENRYSDDDIDFLYADGEIPIDDDARLTTADDGTLHYAPLWPDDYLFFGQNLTYDYPYTDVGAHEDVPSHLNKTGSSHTLETVPESNRVFRTPAYFGNKKMDMYHFNPFAVLAAKSADGQHEAYPGMTAVDFTGYGDTNYSKTLNSDGVFYSPIFDASVSLAGVANADETRNLLVYSPEAGTNNGDVLTAYFSEPEMAEKEDDATTGMKAAYRAVDALTANDIASIHGHLVYRNGTRLYTSADHVLVDRQDFNCPIRYTIGADYRMWYQRTPDNYVDDKKGWEAVSLPFSAELVTTPDKGEITHFYEGSTTGHEYWLREFSGGSVSSSDASTFVADLVKPEAGTFRKEYTNTFLWDYYYSYDSYLDKNEDDYQKTYYQDEHIYAGYPRNAVGTPYIVGFPGSRYYEFDLSGSFVPKYTHSAIEGLDAQAIIFASEPGISIGVSDEELTGVTANGYRFMPNYTNTTLATAGEGYVLAADGGSFDKNEAGAVAVAFRPYFTKAGNGTRGGADQVERIIFGDGSGSKLHPNGDTSEGIGGTLNIYAVKGHIVVESSLGYTTDVRVVTAAGVTVASFAVKPGETVKVRADFSGMYVVHTLDGQYSKSVAVRK